jgi:hypothetical protein
MAQPKKQDMPVFFIARSLTYERKTKVLAPILSNLSLFISVK